MKKIALLITIFLSIIVCKGSELDGQWKGILDFGAQKLNIVTEFSESDGKLSGVMYSIDQSNMPIPMTKVAQNGHKLDFEVAPLNIKFKGDINAEKIKGMFKQNKAETTLILTKEKVAKKMNEEANNFDIPAEMLTILLGKWNAVLKPKAKENANLSLRLNLVFEKTENGKCKAFLISPDQSESKIPANDFEVKNSKIKISFSVIGVSIEGTAKQNKINAKFKQRDIEQKLTFVKDK